MPNNFEWTTWQKHLEAEPKSWPQRIDRAGQRIDSTDGKIEREARMWLVKGINGRKACSAFVYLLLVLLVSLSSFASFSTAVGVTLTASVCQVSREYGVLAMVATLGFLISRAVPWDGELPDNATFSWAAVYFATNLSVWWTLVRWGVHASSRLVPRLGEYVVHFFVRFSNTYLERHAKLLSGPADMYGYILPLEANRRDGVSREELRILHIRVWVMMPLAAAAAGVSFVSLHHLRASLYPVQIEWKPLLAAAAALSSLLIVRMMESRALLLKFPPLQRNMLFRLKARLPLVIASSVLPASVAVLVYALQAGRWLDTHLAAHIAICAAITAINADSAVAVLQVFLTQRTEFIDPQGCPSPNQNLVAALKASDQLESGLMKAYGYLDMCELAKHSLQRRLRFFEDRGNSASEMVQTITMYTIAPLANDLDELCLVPLEPRELMNEPALALLARSLHGTGAPRWMPACVHRFLQPSVRNPFHDVQIAVWGIRALVSMLSHACDSRHPDRRGCVADNVVDIASSLARLRCSLSDFHHKLSFVARSQHLSSLLPLSGDYSTLSTTVDIALYSIVNLFHARRPPLAPILPLHGAERRRSALNVNDSERISNTGRILELLELPPAYLGEAKIRDINNMQVSVPKPVLLWADQCQSFNQTQDQLNEEQRKLGEAMLGCRNERLASDRLGEILRREADLYVESEELWRRHNGTQQPQQQPQWGQLSGEELYHEKDALRQRYGELDPLRSRNTHTPFRSTSLYAEKDRRSSVLDFDKSSSVVDLRLQAISQELEKLQHEKRVLTEGDSNRRAAIETAREAIQTRTSDLTKAHEDLNLRRSHAQQLLGRISKQLQVYEDFLN